MIQTATKYASVQQARTGAVRTSGPRSAPAQIFVPRPDRDPQLLQEWYWKELRSGFLLNYIARERATSGQRLRAVARQHYGRRPNLKSDFRQLARVPAREFFRWKAVDEHFWDDDNNLRSFRRDNPDALIHVDPLPLPRARFHKKYAASGEAPQPQPC